MRSRCRPKTVAPIGTLRGGVAGKPGSRAAGKASFGAIGTWELLRSSNRISRPVRRDSGGAGTGQRCEFDMAGIWRRSGIPLGDAHKYIATNGCTAPYRRCRDRPGNLCFNEEGRTRSGQGEGGDGPLPQRRRLGAPWVWPSPGSVRQAHQSENSQRRHAAPVHAAHVVRGQQCFDGEVRMPPQRA